VFGYSKELHLMDNMPIATVCTVWTNPTTGKNVILVLNQCVYLRTQLKHSLICPNQLCAHGVVVDDIPTQFDAKSQHAIIHHKLTIPLDMSVVVSNFETQAPKPWEINSLKQSVLTLDTDC
jgi:hypothetical protein